MPDVEPFPTPARTEDSIKDASEKVTAATPSLDVNKRVHLAHFSRLLSRGFFEGANIEWGLKGGIGIFAEVPSTRSARHTDIYRAGFTLAAVLDDLIRQAPIDHGDHFRFEHAGHSDSISTYNQP